jgi:6-phosphofructokinase 1
MYALFEEEGKEIFDVRQSILGHLQQGGNPTPFDRILATRLADRCINFLVEKHNAQTKQSAFIGFHDGSIQFHDMEDFPRMVNFEFQRPKNQWWMELLPIAKLLAGTGPVSAQHEIDSDLHSGGKV